MSAFQTAHTDFDEMFWPQILRGIGDHVLPAAADPARARPICPERIADASGLFNLMRNLGGAIGIALIDSILYGRVGAYAGEFP